MRMMMVFSGRALLLFTLLASGVVSLSGCAQLSKNEPTESPPSKASTDVDEEKPANKPAPLLSIKQILQLIDDGEHDQAQASLEAFLAKNPKNQLARTLQKQLAMDPAKALGPAVSTYTVQPGDTLGSLAARFLGNPMDFVILGRYNDIKRGRDLKVGQTIKIPSQKKLMARPDEPPSTKTGALTAKAPAVESETAKPVQSVARVDLQEAPAAETQTVKLEAKVTGPISSVEEAKALAAQQAGLAAMQKNQLEKAQNEFTKALAIDPGLELSKTQAAKVLAKRVQRYHEAALVAYRQQHLDAAIALWDKALALDPNYEPALGYRARAQELKRRLGQLNKQ